MSILTKSLTKLNIKQVSKKRSCSINPYFEPRWHLFVRRPIPLHLTRGCESKVEPSVVFSTADPPSDHSPAELTSSECIRLYRARPT